MTPVSWVGDVVDTLPKTHVSPAKLPSQKGKDCLNPPFFFRGYDRFGGRVSITQDANRWLFENAA